MRSRQVTLADAVQRVRPRSWRTPAGAGAAAGGRGVPVRHALLRDRFAATATDATTKATPVTAV